MSTSKSNDTECVELTSQDGSAVFLLDVDMQQVKFARFRGSDRWTTLTLTCDDDTDLPVITDAVSVACLLLINTANGMF